MQKKNAFHDSMPPLKRQRRFGLQDLSGIGCVSDTALSQILAALQDAGELNSGTFSHASARTIARNAITFIQQKTLYGPPIQTLSLPTKCGEMKLEYGHPPAMLSFLVNESPALADVLFEAHTKRASSPQCPWHLVWYEDESTPGNILSLDTALKSALIYWSFRELGFEALSQKCCWFLGGLLRTSKVGKVEGGMTCIFGKHLATFFGEEHNLARTGFTVHAADGRVATIFAVLGTTVGDEAALKQLWAVKGAAGMRPCILCRNLISERAGLDLGPGNRLVDTTCSKLSSFEPHTDDTIWECARRVSSPLLSRNGRERLTTLLGVNCVPNSILCNELMKPHAKPATTFMVDPSHTMFVNGVFQTEMTLFIDAVKNTFGLNMYETMQKYVEQWTCPKHVGNRTGDIVFAQSRAGDGTFKSGASHCFALYGIIREWVRRVLPEGVLVPEKKSLLAMFRVVGAYLTIQARREPPDFQKRCEDFHQAHQ